MKKTYITPNLRMTVCYGETLICASIAGVEGTAKFSSDLSEETTGEALSRHVDAWDEE